jgi:carboxypeptidase D
MYLKALRRLLLAASLLQAVSGSRMSEVSKRKGFSPHLKRAPEPPKHKRFVNETDTYRFYTNDTARKSYWTFGIMLHMTDNS